MLAGVQHQQQTATGERLCQALHRRLAAEFQPDRGGDRGRNQAEIGKRRELGQPNPVGKSRSKGEAHRQRRGFRAGTQKPVECMRRIVFLLYQKGRDSRIFQEFTSPEICGCALHKVLRSKIIVSETCRLRRSIDGARIIYLKFSISVLYKAEARFAGYITRDNCSAPVRGADPLRPKRAHAQRPASRADRRLDPRIWLHQPGADRAYSIAQAGENLHRLRSVDAHYIRFSDRKLSYLRLAACDGQSTARG